MACTRREFLAGALGAAAWAAVPGLSASTKGQTMQPIEVGSQKQLFVDDLFLAERRGVELVMNRPHLTGERNIIADRPWEGHRICAYNSVWEDGGLFKCWYDAIDNAGGRWLCYATSTDGVHWEKPELGLVEFGGNRRNNILFPPRHENHEPNCVFIDANPQCPPAERYKMVCNIQPRGGETGTHVATSADGLRWNVLPRRAFRGSDTGNVCFFDQRLGRYVAYVRTWTPMRMVGRCEFDDFGDWGKEKVVLGYDDEDQRGLDGNVFTGMDFYTPGALQYPDAQAYFLFPTAYYHYRPEVAERLGTAAGRPWGGWNNDGPMDIQMAAGRDGVTFNRIDRRPFIALGPTGGWDGGYAYLAFGAIFRPEEIWLYYATCESTHGNYSVAKDKGMGTLTRAVIRRDGFTSVDAGYGGGEFATPPLTFRGRELALNVQTSAGGHAVVEVQGADGKPVAGLAAADCDTVSGNYLRRVVTWQGKSDLSALAGKPVRLRVGMRDAKLYSFGFA